MEEKCNDLDALCMRRSAGENDTTLLNNRHFTITTAEGDFVITTHYSIHLETAYSLHFVSRTQLVCAEHTDAR